MPTRFTLNGLATELFSLGTGDFKARLFIEDAETEVALDYHAVRDWSKRLAALADRLQELNNLDERGHKRRAPKQNVFQSVLEGGERAEEPITPAPGSSDSAGEDLSNCTCGRDNELGSNHNENCPLYTPF